MKTKIPRIVPSMPNWVLAALFGGIAAVTLFISHHFETIEQYPNVAG